MLPTSFLDFFQLVIFSLNNSSMCPFFFIFILFILCPVHPFPLSSANQNSPHTLPFCSYSLQSYFWVIFILLQSSDWLNCFNCLSQWANEHSSRTFGSLKKPSLRQLQRWIFSSCSLDALTGPVSRFMAGFQPSYHLFVLCSDFSVKLSIRRSFFLVNGAFFIWERWMKEELEKLLEQKLWGWGGSRHAIGSISFPNKESDLCHLDSISCCLIKSGMTPASPLLMVIISTPPSPLLPHPHTQHTCPPHHPRIQQPRGTSPDIYTKTRRRSSPATPAALSGKKVQCIGGEALKTDGRLLSSHIQSMLWDTEEGLGKMTLPTHHPLC